MSSSKYQSWMQKGFSMVEVTVAMGLLGVAAVAVMNLTDNVQTNATRSEASVARSQFAIDLGNHINSIQGCQEFVGRTFSMNKNSPTAVTLTQWKNINSTDKAGNRITNLRGDSPPPGTEFRYFRVKTLNAYVDVAGGWGGLPKVPINGIQHAKANLKISLVVNLPPPTNRDFEYFYNIPVLARSNGYVAFCDQTKNLHETCVAMKGTLDASGVCQMDKACIPKGTYQQLTCSPSNYGCSGAEGGSVNNPVTNAPSCPPGATRYQTGNKTWNHSVSCGKKCTANISNQMNWYTCLECP